MIISLTEKCVGESMKVNENVRCREHMEHDPSISSLERELEMKQDPGKHV